jgi:hypothetical protein
MGMFTKFAPRFDVFHSLLGWLATYVTPSSYARRKLLARNRLVFTMLLVLKEG